MLVHLVIILEKEPQLTPPLHGGETRLSQASGVGNTQKEVCKSIPSNRSVKGKTTPRRLPINKSRQIWFNVGPHGKQVLTFCYGKMVSYRPVVIFRIVISERLNGSKAHD